MTKELYAWKTFDKVRLKQIYLYQRSDGAFVVAISTLDKRTLTRIKTMTVYSIDTLDEIFRLYIEKFPGVSKVFQCY